MTNDERDELIDIINNLPPECSYIDYKQEIYNLAHTNDIGASAKFIKDVSSMLNSLESYNHNKFIVLGITNKRERIGIEKDIAKFDDADYQQALDNYIFPRPYRVLVGSIPVLADDGIEHTYGFVFISKDNNDRPYSICKDINSQKDIPYNERVLETQAFIRHGSRNSPLSEPERRLIYEKSKAIDSFNNSDASKIENINFRDIVYRTSLIGGWNKSNKKDLRAIESFVRDEYRTIDNIIGFKDASPLIFEQKDQNISVKNKVDFLTMNYQDIGQSMIDDFIQYAKNIITSPGISEQLVLSLFDSLALLKSLKFNIDYYLIEDALNTSKSNKIIGKALPLIAEISPEQYIRFFECNLLFPESPRLRDEDIRYVPSVLGLEIASNSANSLQRACKILLKNIVEGREKLLDVVINLLVLWESRSGITPKEKVAIIRNLLHVKVKKALFWNMLLGLLPGQTSSIISASKPAYLIIPESKISAKDYWEATNNLLDIAIGLAKNSNLRLCDLTKILPFVSARMLENIMSRISNSANKMADSQKYSVWDAAKTVCYQIVDSKSDDKEFKNRIEGYVNSLEPKNIAYRCVRLFKKDYWSLTDEYKRENNGLTLRNDRRSMICAVFSKTDNSIEILLKNAEDKFSLGCALYDAFGVEKLDFVLTPNNGISKNMKIGYIQSLATEKGVEYYEKECQSWKPADKVQYLLAINASDDLLECVSKLKKYNQKTFWHNYRSVRDVDTKVADAVSKKFYEFGQYNNVIGLAAFQIYTKNKITDLDGVFNSLDKINKDDFQYRNDVAAIIKYFQDNDYNPKKVSKLEIKYSDLFYDKNFAKCTSELMAQDPNFYVSMVKRSLEYGSDFDKTFAAERMLNHWSNVPGVENGILSQKKLRDWLKAVKKLCRDNGPVGYSALYNFGKVLFYSPKDKNGCWIDLFIAKILDNIEEEDIRSGYIEKVVGTPSSMSTADIRDNINKKKEEIRQECSELEAEKLFNFSGLLKEASERFEQLWLREY